MSGAGYWARRLGGLRRRVGVSIALSWLKPAFGGTEFDV